MRNVRNGIEGWLWFSCLALVWALTAPAALALTGDLDGNGQIDLTDAQSALRVAAGITSASPMALSVGDLFPPGRPDGKLDLRDVRTLLTALVNVGDKLETPLLAAYLSSEPDASLSNILAVVPFTGPFSRDLFLGYPKGGSPGLEVKNWDKIEWTGDRMASLRAASAAGIAVEDLGNPFAFYITTTPRRIAKFIQSGEVGRLLLAQLDAPIPSLPSGISADQLVGLYTEAISTVMETFGVSGPFSGLVVIDTRTLVGLTPTQKRDLIQRIERMNGVTMVDGGGEVLVAAHLAKRSVYGDSLEYVGSFSNIGVLVSLSTDLPDRTPVPSDHILAYAWATMSGALGIAFTVISDDTGYHIGDPRLIIQA